MKRDSPRSGVGSVQWCKEYIVSLLLSWSNIKLTSDCSQDILYNTTDVNSHPVNGDKLPVNEINIIARKVAKSVLIFAFAPSSDHSHPSYLLFIPPAHQLHPTTTRRTTMTTTMMEKTTTMTMGRTAATKMVNTVSHPSYKDKARCFDTSFLERKLCMGWDIPTLSTRRSLDFTDPL
jgi:hypothetical protein